MLPTTSGVAGYVAGIAVVTAGYALFQAANNTAVMSAIRADQRGVASGLLNLSRNLGLVTGASAMGALFAFASARAMEPRPIRRLLRPVCGRRCGGGDAGRRGAGRCTRKPTRRAGRACATPPTPLRECGQSTWTSVGED